MASEQDWQSTVGEAGEDVDTLSASDKQIITPWGPEAETQAASGSSTGQGPSAGSGSGSGRKGRPGIGFGAPLEGRQTKPGGKPTA